MKSIYLDYAAATPLDKSVLAKMMPFLQADFQNPSATYLAGRAVKRELEAARAKVSGSLGARPAEIIFTAGATEANNLAISGVMESPPGCELLVSAIEHESVLKPAEKFNAKKVSVDKKGLVKLDDLEKKVTDKTLLISVMLVNNETGAVQPVKEIAAFLREVRKHRSKAGIRTPIYLHTDAAQAPCYVDIHVSRLAVDLMSLNGGKIYGPKQSGCLYVRAGVKLRPQILGGGQEMGVRSGTENVAADVGFAEALDKAVAKRQAESRRVDSLKKAFLTGLDGLPGAEMNGVSKNSSPHIVSVSFAGVDNERLMMQLDEAGVQVAVGSACSASSIEPSHVLKAMGLSRDQARSSLRFSFGRQTTAKDIETTLKLIRRSTTVNR